MGPKGQGSSSRRGWWLLVGGIAVFVVAFSLFERLTRPDPTSPAEGPEGAADAVLSNARPELRRLDDGAIEIRHDFFRRLTIRLGNENEQQALFDCLEQGFEDAFGGGTEGRDRRRVRQETQRIVDECMGLQGMTVPPRPLQPLLAEPEK